MDLEHQLVQKGIAYGYSMSQERDVITIVENVPKDTQNSDIILDFNKKENSIYLGVRGSSPIVCGILYAKVREVQSFKFDSPVVTVKLLKVNNDMWPYLISAKSSRGIDTKSQFLLGVVAESNGNYNEAFKLYSLAAQKNYLPAMRYIAYIYASDENPYNVKANIRESINVYQNMFRVSHDIEIGLILSKSLRKAKRLDEARQILELCANYSNEAKFMLACMLTPLYGELDEPEKSIKLFKELSDNQVIDATKKLIEHYEKGIGTSVNLEEAERLKQELAKAAPVKKSPPSKLWMLVGTIAVGAAAGCIFFGKQIHK